MATARHGANALALADFDGDNDQDLFWGDFFEPGVLLIENIGRTCCTPSFQVDPVPLPFATDCRPSGYNAPAPVDLDGDGDLDFLMGVLGGAFNPITTAGRQLRATGSASRRTSSSCGRGGSSTGSTSAQTRCRRSPTSTPTATSTSSSATRSIARTTGPGPLYVFTNEGTKTAPRFRQADPLQLADAFNLAPAFGDLDADGDLGSAARHLEQGRAVFPERRHRGRSRAGSRTRRATIKPPRVSHATPALADIDGDRDLDLFIGQANGAIVFYRNDGISEERRASRS